jgi:hypothetical protein
MKLWGESQQAKLAIIFFTSVAIIISVSLFYKPFLSLEIWKWAWWEANGEHLRNMVWATAFPILGLSGLVLAMWRTWLSSQQTDTALRQSQLAERGHMTDRFHTGMQMLGDDSMVTRLGGITVLNNLSIDERERYGVNVGEIFVGALPKISREYNKYNAGHLNDSLKSSDEIKEIAPPDIVLIFNHLHDNALNLGKIDSVNYCTKADKVVRFNKHYIQGFQSAGLNYRDMRVGFCQFIDCIFGKCLFIRNTFNTCDFTKIDFTNCDFTDCEFFDCDFGKSNFNRTVFNNCEFNNCNVRNDFTKEHRLVDCKFVLCHTTVGNKGKFNDLFEIPTE